MTHPGAGAEEEAPLHQPRKMVTVPEGYGPLVGSTLSMMNLARQGTLELVAGLDPARLTLRFDPHANSIAMLLAHIAAIEKLYVLRHLAQRPPTPDEAAWLTPRRQLGDAAEEAVKGLSLKDLLEDLARVRVETAEGLRTVGEKTFKMPFMWNGVLVNLHRQFFHVFEDELRHAGQIRWLLKRI